MLDLQVAGSHQGAGEDGFGRPGPAQDPLPQPPLKHPDVFADVAPSEPREASSRPPAGTSASLRGSIGLLVGYGVSQAVNFVVQVGIVRQLSKEEYGAFAWALAAVTLLEAVVPLGLDRANIRFVALYDEQGDAGRLFGFLLLELAVIVGTGATVVAGSLVMLPTWRSVAPSHLAADLLLVLVALAPIHVLDAIVVDMFAVFSSSWAIFLRRYVVEPLLRLTVVVLLFVFHADAVFLSWGFLTVGAFGVALFIYLLSRVFRRIGLAQRFTLGSVVLPWREVATFCGPVLLGSFVATATMELPGVVLGHNGGAAEVAVFRAVMPFGLLNLGVLFAFTTLFTTSASRLAARRAHHDLHDLYWQSAIWVLVLTFPVLAVTTAFAAPFTTLTLGHRYEASAVVLTILSIGLYVNAALGFNGFTIQLLGRTRWILLANTLTLGALIASTHLLVGYGAVGAAFAVLITLVVHNALKQLGLGFGAGIGVVQRGWLVVLLYVAVCLGVLFAIQLLFSPPVWAACACVSFVWLLLLRLTRHSLRLVEVFPEAGRYRFLTWLVHQRRPDPEHRNG
jgi:O-antigen/teichoic acid export membrane protein